MYTTEASTTVDEYGTVTPAVPRLPDLDSEPHYPEPDPLPTSTPALSSTTEVYDIPITFVGDYETVDDHISRHHAQSPPPTSVTTPPEDQPPAAIPSYLPGPDICSGSFDAIGLLRGEIFIFKGAYLWRLTEKYRIKTGYPVRIWQVFRGFPKTVSHIDAVYERLDDNAIVLFSGRFYWVFDALNFLHPEVRPLTDFGLPEELRRIDAALVWREYIVPLLASGYFHSYFHCYIFFFFFALQRKTTRRTCLRAIVSGGTTTRPAKWTKATRPPWTVGLAFRTILMPPRLLLAVSLKRAKKQKQKKCTRHDMALMNGGTACVKKQETKHGPAG